MIKNIATDITLQQDSVFELREGFSGKKIINLDNTSPLKYSALLVDTAIDIQVNTAREGSELEIFLLCPILENKPCSIDIKLNLLHSRCKIDLHIISLVASNQKSHASATIYMQEGIQESASALVEETIILWDKVQVRNLPILDIQANNIQAAHWAKIYRLDPEKLFYLQSKGLSHTQARHLLISSYPTRLFDGVLEDEQLKKQLVTEFLTFD